ncbi:hypothetical protein LCGC14_1831880 [marine sediment metagenome]|uniref:Uncharacterized protein n=1 Tax=marine sediment metagenome TaxID=412755 RepID=A0A0F9IVB3_9ZZZZ
MSEPLEKALRDLLNVHSAENVSNTPDHVLAQFMLGCLDAFNTATQQRETFYGRTPSVAGTELNSDGGTHRNEPETPLGQKPLDVCHVCGNEFITCDEQALDGCPGCGRSAPVTPTRNEPRLGIVQDRLGAEFEMPRRNKPGEE